MIAEVYDAFRSAGADDDKAGAAAIASSEGDRRFDDRPDRGSTLLECNVRLSSVIPIGLPLERMVFG